MSSKRSMTITAGLVAALAAGLLLPLAPSSAAEARPSVQRTKSVPVQEVKRAKLKLPRNDVQAANEALAAESASPVKTPRRGKTRLVSGWSKEAAGLAVRTVGASAAAGSAEVSRLRFRDSNRASSTDLAFRVELPAGAQGKVRGFRVTPAELDRHFGANVLDRVKWSVLTGCEVSQGVVTGCSESTPLKGSTSEAKGASIAVPASASKRSAMVVAASTSASGQSGDYSASPLKPSSSWSAGLQSGGFQWQYAFETPKSINGPSPDLALKYSSEAVDGLTSSTNNQASWVGDGFDLSQGFVERTYEACRYVSGTSNAPAKSNDLCWRDDNLTVSLGGSSGELVQKGSSSEWRLKADDGSRIEQVTDAGRNDDNNGEYWVLTKNDGTKYYFGLNKRMANDAKPTNSVSTVPVYGSKSGQPCHTDDFATSVCDQAWRWNLDYVVDPNGNTMSLFYDQEGNKYGSNDNKTARAYDRSAVLTSIEYGTRKGRENTDNSGKAPMRVLFTTAERCLPTDDQPCGTGDIDADNAHYWPDVPYDQICKGTDCKDSQTAPTFFSRRRLVKVQAEVLGAGGTYLPSMKWDLVQSLPPTGDMSTDPKLKDRHIRTLWLESIQQTGLDGGEAPLPPVKFSGESMENRVDKIGDSIDPFNRFRINAITNNGTGGSIAITYSAKDCTFDNKPAADALDSNRRRCFPVWYLPDWDPEKDERQLEFFHKYRVESVTESGNTGGSPPIVTTYGYDDDEQSGWHYTSSTTERRQYRTWNDWRGYAKVSTRMGLAADEQTYTVKTFLRGMDGDKLQGGGTRSRSVLGVTDTDQAAGFVVAEVTRVGAGGPIVTSELNKPWVSGVTADSGTDQARMIRGAWTEITTPVKDAADRVTRTETTYDPTYGLPTEISDLGDTSTTVGAADNRCTTIDYAQNTASWMLAYPKTTLVVAKTCKTAPTSVDDIISADKLTYDGGTLTRGNVTSSQSVKSFDAGKLEYQTDITKTYDSYGRETTVTNALNEKTITEYAPASGPVDSIVVTNPLGQKLTTNVDRVTGATTSQVAPGDMTTTIASDPLGRTTAVWAAGRATTSSATERYSYEITGTAPNKVTTKTLNAAGEYSTSVTYLDGLLRERATQTMAAGSDTGRLIREKIYDDRGFVEADRGPYYNSGAVGSGMVQAQENEIPGYHVFEYDRAGRVINDIFGARGNAKWNTTTEYGGDRVTVTPPTGGTRTTTVTDARGQTTAMLQYKSATASDKTSYSYNRRGDLASITNAAGTVWSRQYDIRGNLTVNDDPDAGKTTTTYDALDRVQSTKDARGTVLWTTYDAIGRKTGLYNDASGSLGTQRAKWTYDSVKPGLLTSSIRYLDGDLTKAYTNEVLSYDDAGRPKETLLTLPSSEGKLAPTDGYKTRTIYNVDGSVKNIVQPAVPGITNEQLSFSYDKVGNVQTMGGLGSFIAATTRSPYGEPLQRSMGPTVGKSIYDNREYDEATRRLTRHWTSLQGTATTPQQDLRYVYDASGNITQLNDVAAGDTNQSTASTWRQCFAYDYLRRMTDAWTAPANSCATKPSTTSPDLGGVNQYWDQFTFDLSGNRTKRVQRTKSGSSNITTTWTPVFPGATEQRPHAPKSVSVAKTGATTTSEAFDYDASGNTREDGKRTIAWDAEGKQDTVTTKSTPSKQVKYVYDADGNLLLKRDGVTGKNTLYVGTAEVTLEGSTATSTRTYTLDDEPVAMRDADGLKILTADHHNSVSMVIDGSTLKVTKRRLDPFGNPLTSTAWPTSRGFLNKPVDESAGSIHIGAREYNSALGRFLSVDPIVDPLDPQQMNGYAYANNAPVTSSDPTGLRTDGGQGASYAGVETSGGVCGDCQYESAQFFRATSNYSPRVLQNLVGGVVNAINDIATVADYATNPAIIVPKLLGFGPPTLHDWANDRLQDKLETDPDSAAFKAGEWSTAALPLPGVPLANLGVRLGTRVGESLLLRGAERLAEKGLATGADEAVFWSGVGRGGDKIAAEWAKKNGGATLETTLASRGKSLPAWDAGNPEAVAAWQNASAEFAQGASGHVRVLLGDKIRPDSVWASIEFPALKANKSVSSITAINPETGSSKVLWSRK